MRKKSSAPDGTNSLNYAKKKYKNKQFQVIERIIYLLLENKNKNI